MVGCGEKATGGSSGCSVEEVATSHVGEFIRWRGVPQSEVIVQPPDCLHLPLEFADATFQVYIAKAAFGRQARQRSIVNSGFAVLKNDVKRRLAQEGEIMEIGAEEEFARAIRFPNRNIVALRDLFRDRIFEVVVKGEEQVAVAGFQVADQIFPMFVEKR